MDFDEAGQIGTMIGFCVFMVIPGALVYWLIATRFVVLNTAARRTLLPSLIKNPANFDHSRRRRVTAAFVGVVITAVLETSMWRILKARFSGLDITAEHVLLHYPFDRHPQSLERKGTTATIEGFGQDACLVVQDGNGAEFRSHPMTEQQIRTRLETVNLLLQKK